MFEDSLIESAGVLKTKRSAATAASLILQSALVAVLAGLPLVYTEALPSRLDKIMVALGPPASAPAPAAAEHRPTRPVESDMAGAGLREPREIPKNIAHIVEVAAAIAGPSFAGFRRVQRHGRGQ